LVRYGVLGLLIERRGYGYELVQRLRARLGSAWQLNPSAVYTALDQLEAAGLIEQAPPAASAAAAPASELGARERVSRRATRVVYHATEAGRCAFEQWMSQPSRRIEAVRSELALKVALLSPESVPALLATIHHEERLIMSALGEHGQAQVYESHPPPAAVPLRLAGARSRNGADASVAVHGMPRHEEPCREVPCHEMPCGEAPHHEVPCSAAERWAAAATALVDAAAVSRLQAELVWLGSVRAAVERLLGEHLAAPGPLHAAGARRAGGGRDLTAAPLRSRPAN
jgi:DNA-binding PadR family transcriptional regulator